MENTFINELIGLIDKYYINNDIKVIIIKKLVVKYTGILLPKLFSKTRKSNIVIARQMTQYLIRKHTKLPLEEIGRITGRRNHATVLHSCRVIEKKLVDDKELQQIINQIEIEIEINKFPTK